MPGQSGPGMYPNQQMMGMGGGGMMGNPMMNGYNGMMNGGGMGQMGQMGMGGMGMGGMGYPQQGIMGQGNLAMGMIPMGNNGMGIPESQAAPVSYPNNFRVKLIDRVCTLTPTEHNQVSLGVIRRLIKWGTQRFPVADMGIWAEVINRGDMGMGSLDITRL